jgi:hypothetical protein
MRALWKLAQESHCCILLPQRHQTKCIAKHMDGVDGLASCDTLIPSLPNIYVFKLFSVI